MIAWIKSMFEDAHGVPDDARVAAFLLVLGFLAQSAWSIVVEHRPFDPVQYGSGAAALAAGIGAWFGLRRDQ